MGCCGAFQDEVDFRASHSRRAVEAHSRVIGVLLVVINGTSYVEHVSGNGLVALGPRERCWGGSEHVTGKRHALRGVEVERERLFSLHNHADL